VRPSNYKRVILVVLDSVGIGELPDARDYGDEGSNTLGNIAAKLGSLTLPNMEQLGLGELVNLGHTPLSRKELKGSWGKMAEASKGKDTMTGHWEISGLILDRPFPVYPKGFPESLISEFERRIGTRTLGNYPSSGTVIIEKLGEEHLRTGYPIVYTSADSVFQIAMHEDVVPIERQYEICQIARDTLVGEHCVGRVIARPFAGKPGNFKRTGRRRDFGIRPFQPTLLDRLKKDGQSVFAVGKIENIFSGQGITRAFHIKDNMDGIDKTLYCMKNMSAQGLVFSNLVDFDMLWGHRNDVEGYARGLVDFDRRLPEIISAMEPRDILVLTADHGCDPTTVSTDHSREYVPVLLYDGPVRAGVDVGVRKTFADLGQTVAEYLGVGPLENGVSFLGSILQ